MDFYMYKAVCPRWYGYHSNIRHLVVTKNTRESEVKKMAQTTSNEITGSKSCNIQLLQKYHMLIEAKKSYPALTGLTFHGQKLNNIKVPCETNDSKEAEIQNSEK